MHACKTYRTCRQKLTGCGEDANQQADLPVAQQGHVRRLRLRPVLVPSGLDGGPDADAEHQQVEQQGGQQTRDVESHVASEAAAAQTELVYGCRKAPVQPEDWPH